jgi:predicted DNA binding CopG/RHH family protein
LVQGIGEREKRYMKKKITYSNEPIKARLIKDFLPRPENLVLHEKKKRVTITLTRNSIDFFKKAAKKHNTSYQGMIRRLIDYYVTNQ